MYAFTTETLKKSKYNIFFTYNQNLIFKSKQS